MSNRNLSLLKNFSSQSIITSLLALSVTSSTIFAQTPSLLNIKYLPATNIKYYLPISDNLGQSRPGVPNTSSTNTSNPAQSRPGVPNTSTSSNSQSRPGVVSSGQGKISRPGVGNSLGLAAGMSLSRPGVAAVSRPGVELSQALGVQQVGEASAQATRRIIAATAKTGPEAIVESADKLVDKGDRDSIEKAIDKYRGVIKETPNLASAYAGLGYAYIQIEEFDLAVENLKIALEKNNKDQETQLNLGVALYRGGNITEAIEQYKNLTDTKSASAEVHYNLGIAYAHEGEFEKAIDEINTAITKRKNKYPEAYNNLGLIYEAKGDVAKAIELFEASVLQQNGNNPLASYNLARLYLNKANSKESKLSAIDQYKKAIKQKTSFAEAYLDMGNAYIYLTIHSVESLPDALKAYQDALKLRGGIYPLAHENIAITYSKMGKLEEALKHYYLAFEQYDGRCPEALHNLTTTLSEGTFTISNELLQANNAASLKNKQLKKESEKNKGNTEKIDEVFFRTMKNLLFYEEIDDKKKDDPLVRYCGGRAYAFVGDWYSATNEFISAIELAKKDPKSSNITVGAEKINVVNDAERALITITSNNLVAMLP
ncbi:MAG: tetratricopeptide repeat protein [Acidobacteria bacterium]|nr:tetratricopeptide repeat protein [Acidobacteriota bacterium]